VSAQQDMYQALCDVFGWDAERLPRSAKTRVLKVGKELRDVGATPEQVRFARGVLDRRFGPDRLYGPEAIALWWGEVDKQWRAKEQARRKLELVRAVEPEYVPLTVVENRRRWYEMVGRFGRPVK